MMRFCFLIIFFLSAFGYILPAHAQSHSGLIPNVPGNGDSFEEAPIIYVSPDQTRVVRLDQDATSVIVTNPSHAQVLIDTPRLLIVVPQEPGATTFTALDGNGNIIETRHVIVGAKKKRYVRIRRACNNAENSACESTSLFFCPGDCHRVNVVGASSESSGTDSAAVSGMPAGAPPQNISNNQETN